MKAALITAIVLLIFKLLTDGLFLVSNLSVRHHINWNKQRPDLKEDLAHLVQDIKRRICGIASAGSPSF